VLYDQAALAENAGGIRAVLTNAGNANACTGEEGIANTRRMAELTAYALRCQPEDVLILSTGVIGRQLPMDKVTQGIAEVTSKVADTAPLQAARAIMTTDTKPKLSTRQFESNGQTDDQRLLQGRGHDPPKHGDHAGDHHHRRHC
jgi:glutamate N-acetyltransferase/amino-acid N-acetyltransferase